MVAQGEELRNRANTPDISSCGGWGKARRSTDAIVGLFEDEGTADFEHGDVVLLAVGGGGGGDVLCREDGDGGGALETEELSGFRAGFSNAVGEEGEILIDFEAKDGFGVDRFGGDAERKSVVDGELLCAGIRCEVASVGERS
jgi:hypothetical protein